MSQFGTRQVSELQPTGNFFTFNGNIARLTQTGGKT